VFAFKLIRKSLIAQLTGEYGRHRGGCYLTQFMPHNLSKFILAVDPVVTQRNEVRAHFRPLHIPEVCKKALLMDEISENAKD
jgi:hypothetical protein